MNELDQFIGTEIWVKVRVKIEGRFFYSFIRLLSKDVETKTSAYSNYTYDITTYTFNEVPITRVSKNGECHCTKEFAEYKLKTKYKVSSDDIKLLKPMDLITTEELFIYPEEE